LLLLWLLLFAECGSRLWQVKLVASSKGWGMIPALHVNTLFDIATHFACSLIASDIPFPALPTLATSPLSQID